MILGCDSKLVYNICMSTISGVMILSIIMFKDSSKKEAKIEYNRVKKIEKYIVPF